MSLHVVTICTSTWTFVSSRPPAGFCSVKTDEMTICATGAPGAHTGRGLIPNARRAVKWKSTKAYQSNINIINSSYLTVISSCGLRRMRLQRWGGLWAGLLQVKQTQMESKIYIYYHLLLYIILYNHHSSSRCYWCICIGVYTFNHKGKRGQQRRKQKVVLECYQMLQERCDIWDKRQKILSRSQRGWRTLPQSRIKFWHHEMAYPQCVKICQDMSNRESVGLALRVASWIRQNCSGASWRSHASEEWWRDNNSERE